MQSLFELARVPGDLLAEGIQARQCVSMQILRNLTDLARCESHRLYNYELAVHICREAIDVADRAMRSLQGTRSLPDKAPQSPSTRLEISSQDSVVIRSMSDRVEERE
jgi:hypothetical protein